MRRVLLAAMLAVVAGAACAEDKTKDKPKDTSPAEVKPADSDAKDKKETPSRGERFKSIVADWQKAQEPIRKEFAALKTDEEREALIAKLPSRFESFVDQALRLAEEDLKDEAAFQALMFAMMVGHNEKAAVLLATTQDANPQLPQVCLMLGTQADNNAAAEKMLQTVFAKGKSKELQGHGGLGLAQLLYRKSEDSKTADAAKALSEAEAAAAKVEKEYGEVKSLDGTLKSAAGKLLFEIRNLAIGKTAPEVVSQDLDGKEAKLSTYRGKVVVIDIWATWCGPCRAMIPHEREMVEKFKDKPFALISISADDEKEDLKKFLEKEKMPWIHWWEGRKDKGVLKDWNVQFFPTIYVLDRGGIIRYKGLRGKKLEEAVEKLLSEAVKKS